MKWIGISGTWRITTPELEKDLRKAVSEIFENGNGIVSGGALGVDYIALDEALKFDSEAKRIKIIIPVSLPVFTDLFRTRANEGVITKEQAEQAIEILENLVSRNPDALEEMNFTVCKKSTYHARNTRIAEESDELMAFQVNGSAGTQDTINKAERSGVKVYLHSYSV